MKKTVLIAISFCALCGFAITATQSDQPVTPLSVDTSFVEDSFWNDGKAEVAKYNATQTIYGKARECEYVMVTVKEAFNQEFMVKTDDYSRDDLFPVVKVNLFARAETDNYPYHFMTSLFFKRPSPTSLHKFSGSVQEWCGNSFKRIQRTDDGLDYTYDSYWDGEGAGQDQLAPGALLEDQLFYTLRTLKYEDGMTFTRKVYPSFIRSKASVQEPIMADFSVEQVEIVNGDPMWKITMEREDGASAEWVMIENEYHHLRSFNHSDGRSWILASVERTAYWQH